MSREEVYTWMSEILEHMPSLGKWQAAGLALFSLGVILAERTSVWAVSKWLWAFGERESVAKRLKRLLSNESLDLRAVQVEWVGWVSSYFGVEDLVLLVDETKLGKALSVMMVGLAYRQRCIPLVWRCYRPKTYPKEGQVRLIMDLLERVQAGLPTGARPLLEADRGLGTSPRLVRAIAGLGWRYLMRVQNGVHLKTFCGKDHRLRDLVKRGESWSGQGFVFKKHGAMRAYVHVYWDWQEQDMWCLLTNDQSLAYQAYALRNWQEQSFRDLKSGGFNWQRSQVRQVEHAQRLLLVLALAYARLLSVGSTAPAPLTHDFPRVSRQSRPQRSLFSQGLAFTWTALLRHLPILPGLFFVPDPALRPLLC